VPRFPPDERRAHAVMGRQGRIAKRGSARLGVLRGPKRDGSAKSRKGTLTPDGKLGVLWARILEGLRARSCPRPPLAPGFSSHLRSRVTLHTQPHSADIRDRQHARTAAVFFVIRRGGAAARTFPPDRHRGAAGEDEGAAEVLSSTVQDPRHRPRAREPEVRSIRRSTGGAFRNLVRAYDGGGLSLSAGVGGGQSQKTLQPG